MIKRSFCIALFVLVTSFVSAETSKPAVPYEVPQGWFYRAPTSLMTENERRDLVFKKGVFMKNLGHLIEAKECFEKLLKKGHRVEECELQLQAIEDQLRGQETKNES